MVRGAKIPMEFIKDRKARLSTFLTRRKGLEKKTHELSTLCGVQVALIVFAPQDIISTKIDKEPLLYPQDPNQINYTIHSFLSSDPMERNRRSTDLSGFYLDKTKKAKDELIRLKKTKIESLYPTWDQTYNNFSAEQLRLFGDQLEANIQAAKSRLDSMKRSRLSGLTSSGSNTNLYEGGNLSSWPVSAMFGWNSMQTDVIQSQEITQGTGLYLPPFENAMADSPGSMWTREGVSSSSAVMFNRDLEAIHSYNSSSSSNYPLLHMDMESEVGRHNMMAGGFLESTDTGIFEKQNDDYFLLPFTEQRHAPSYLESETGEHNMMSGFLESTDAGIFENQHDHFFLLPPMGTMQ